MAYISLLFQLGIQSSTLTTNICLNEFVITIDKCKQYHREELLVVVVKRPRTWRTFKCNVFGVNGAKHIRKITFLHKSISDSGSVNKLKPPGNNILAYRRFRFAFITATWFWRCAIMHKWEYNDPLIHSNCDITHMYRYVHFSCIVFIWKKVGVKNSNGLNAFNLRNASVYQ